GALIVSAPGKVNPSEDAKPRAAPAKARSQALLPVKAWPSERNGDVGSPPPTQGWRHGGTPRSMRAMMSAIRGSRGLDMGASGRWRRAKSRFARPLASSLPPFPRGRSAAEQEPRAPPPAAPISPLCSSRKDGLGRPLGEDRREHLG